MLLLCVAYYCSVCSVIISMYATRPITGCSFTQCNILSTCAISATMSLISPTSVISRKGTYDQEKRAQQRVFILFIWQQPSSNCTLPRQVQIWVALPSQQTRAYLQQISCPFSLLVWDWLDLISLNQFLSERNNCNCRISQLTGCLPSYCESKSVLTDSQACNDRTISENAYSFMKHLDTRQAKSLDKWAQQHDKH